MRDLSLVGLSDDGRYLILRQITSGQEFRLRTDRRLQAFAERAPGAHHRSGQLEIPMESTLTPREIQTRIRRGESVEQVAEAATTGVDQIIGFATPVLAEREHMAQTARATTVRRKHVSGTPVALGVLVDDALLLRGIAPEDASWDSWRREDGLWAVQMTLPDLSSAVFVFHPKSRYVLADDQEASDLVGDLATEDSLDMAIADAVRNNVQQTDNVRSTQDQGSIELDAAPQPDHAPVHSLKEARDRRAMEQLALVEEADAPQEPAADQTDDPSHDPSARKKDRRRSVPSWDEIMFGGKRE